MSQFHRDNPELVGTEADPWMQNEGYRRAMGVSDPGEPVDADPEPEDEEPE